MLATRALHFARTDKLDDPFEGSWTKNEAPLELWENGKPVYPQPSQEELRKRFPKHETPELRAATWRTRRESTAVNCWYAGEHESAAMWRLYSSEGIAVRTTLAKLIQSLPKGAPGDGTNAIQVGQVQYVDYETDFMPVGNSYWPFMHKRLSFEHEREVRAVIHEIGKNMIDYGSFGIREPGVPPEGLLVPVAIESLVQSLHIAPSSPSWFAAAVSDVVDRFGYRFPVVQSQLDAAPFH
jgi:hypothetical protein